MQCFVCGLLKAAPNSGLSYENVTLLTSQMVLCSFSTDCELVLCHVLAGSCFPASTVGVGMKGNVSALWLNLHF